MTTDNKVVFLAFRTPETKTDVEEILSCNNCINHGQTSSAKMKTWKGQEFEREWHRAIVEWIDGGRVGGVPAWQASVNGVDWVGLDYTREPRFLDDYYRWKPKPKRTVTINGKVLVAPEVDAPAMYARYYTPNRPHETMIWSNYDFDKSELENGNVFLTREDAQAMADWLVKCRRGET